MHFQTMDLQIYALEIRCAKQNGLSGLQKAVCCCISPLFNWKLLLAKMNLVPQIPRGKVTIFGFAIAQLDFPAIFLSKPLLSKGQKTLRKSTRPLIPLYTLQINALPHNYPIWLNLLKKLKNGALKPGFKAPTISRNCLQQTWTKKKHE